MAEVFRARLSGPAGFEKQLALKLILPHFSDETEFVEMFIHEATLAARLDHANIVRIHEFDRIDDRYYIAMELVDGKDLRAVLARCRELGRLLQPGEAVLTALEVSRGLAFAHGELTPGADEVIHRDISPHNIILSRAGEVKITDFGIAKLAAAASMTQTGTVKGKLAYMSPEQATGAVLDRRSDLFSLGCVLWELLCGRRLFAGANDLATLENLKSAPIRPPSAFAPAVPAVLDELVLALLARDRERRPGSAAEVGRRLEAVLRALPELDRATALANLFQELFGQRPTPRGTAVMPAEEPAAAGAPLEDAVTVASQAHAAHHLQPKAPPEGSGEPIGGSGEPIGGSGEPIGGSGEPGDGIEPIGPDAETDVKSRPPAGRGPLRWWLLPLMLGPLAALLLVLWLLGPDRTPDESQVAAADQEPTTDRAGGSQQDPEKQAVMVIDGATGRRVGGTPAGGEVAGGEVAGTSDGTPDGGTREGPVSDGGVKVAGVKVAGTPDGSTPDGSNPGGNPDGAAATADRSRRAAHGRLSLNVIPWARVRLGKRLLGDTPLRRVRLPAGRHLLLLVNGELGVRRRIRVEIRPGQHTRRLVDLRPAASDRR